MLVTRTRNPLAVGFYFDKRVDSHTSYIKLSAPLALSVTRLFLLSSIQKPTPNLALETFKGY